MSGQKGFKQEQIELVKPNTCGGFHSMVDILVATPGRIVDHIQKTEVCSLTQKSSACILFTTDSTTASLTCSRIVTCVLVVMERDHDARWRLVKGDAPGLSNSPSLEQDRDEKFYVLTRLDLVSENLVNSESASLCQ